MKRALYLAALLAATSVPAFADPVTYSFTGDMTGALLASSNPLFSNIDPNSPLVVDGKQFLDGNPLVVGTITFDPDYQASSHLPVPVGLTFTFEGLTITRQASIGAIGVDQLTVDPTTGSMTTHLEGGFSSTGLNPDRADVTLNFDNGSFTGGTFNFADIEGGLAGPDRIMGGNFHGVISSVTPVGVPEPGEFALLLTGFAAVIGLSMRRRGALLARG